MDESEVPVVHLGRLITIFVSPFLQVGDASLTFRPNFTPFCDVDVPSDESRYSGGFLARGCIAHQWLAPEPPGVSCRQSLQGPNEALQMSRR